MEQTVRNSQLMIHSEWCKGCGICVAFCPRGVLTLSEGKVHISDLDNCVQCAMCEKLCPDYAITIAAKGDD